MDFATFRGCVREIWGKLLRHVWEMFGEVVEHVGDIWGDFDQIVINIMYWAILYNPAWATLSAVNVIAHGGIGAMTVLDLLATSRVPFGKSVLDLLHTYYFGLTYLGFNLIGVHLVRADQHRLEKRLRRRLGRGIHETLHALLQHVQRRIKTIPVGPACYSPPPS